MIKSLLILILCLNTTLIFSQSITNTKTMIKNKEMKDTLTYLEFESDLAKVLKEKGWITSYTFDRQNSYIDWTELGKSKWSDFQRNIREIYGFDTEIEERYLLSFGQYYGIIKKTKKEEMVSKIRTWISDNDFIVVVTSKNDSVSYYLFHSIDDDRLFNLIEKANEESAKVTFIEMNAILGSNVNKWTLFGNQ